MPKKTMLVKTVLKGDDIQKFEAIKKHHGVLHKSEVIRICLNECFKEILKEA